MIIRSLIFCVVFIATPNLFAQTPQEKTKQTFVLYDLYDRLINSEKLTTQYSYVFVDFFALSCAPCKDALKKIDAQSTLFKTKKIGRVLIAIPEEKPERRDDELKKVQGFFPNKIIQGEYYLWDKYLKTAKAFKVITDGAASLPLFSILNRRGEEIFKSNNVDHLLTFLLKLP